MITQSQAIVVLNAGSSSLKFSLYQAATPSLHLIASGQFEGLGSTPRFEVTDDQGLPLAGPALTAGQKDFDHSAALEHLTTWLDATYDDQMTLLAVGHRITHGGPECIEPVLIDDDILALLQELVPLAPLHQPHNLAGVKAVSRLWPDVAQIACFDTSFHRNRPHVTERFGLPDDLFDQGIKRWGFHGLSYESITARFATIAPRLASGRIIVAHLGNGASLCAIKAGRSVDTTMSFSTLDGLPMGSRCGALDPGVILHLLGHMSPQEIEQLLYHRSGLLGISGISSDMRVLLASTDPKAAEAVDYFVYRVIREIGSLTAALGGLDALIFTAGIGVHSSAIRARVCAGLAWLGIAIDGAANQRGDQCISPANRAPSVWVIPPDEEGVIAAHTWSIVSLLPHRFCHDRGVRSDRASLNQRLKNGI